MKNCLVLLSFVFSIQVHSQSNGGVGLEMGVQHETVKSGLPGQQDSALSSSAGAANPSEALRGPTSATSLDDVISSALTKVVSKTESTKGRVAVMDFPSLDGKATGLSTYIANKAGNKLIEVGRQVVDRATLEKVISEQKLQQNALMDAGTAAKIGKLAGAGVFIIGNYTLLSSKFVLTVRALSVESGQFIPGAVAEETVKSVSSEMLSEIRELSGVGTATAVSPNLDGAHDASSTMTPEREEELRAELAFLKGVCKTINKNMNFGKIIKLAYENDLLLRDEYGEMPHESRCEDSLGEQNYQTDCYTVSGFTFQVSGYLNKDGVAKAIKGKTIDSNVKKWMYNGPSNLPGIEQCAPNGSEWNESRAGAKKPKK